MAACSDASLADATIDAQDSGSPPTHSYTFVVDQLTYDPNDSTTVPHTGFNLDGLFSSTGDPDGCNHEDYFSLLPDDPNCPSVDPVTHRCADVSGSSCMMGSPGCEGGIDAYIPVCVTDYCPDVRTMIADAIAQSRMVTLIRVTNIEDDLSDPNVDVYVYRGFATFSTDCGEIIAGRTYSVARDSIAPGGTSLDDASFHARGVITNGRLRVDGGTATLSGVPPFVTMIGPESIMWVGHAVHLAGDLSAREITRGAIGFWIAGNDVRDTLCAAQPSFCSVVMGAIGGLVDIQIDGVCDVPTGTMHQFGGISSGLGLHAVPAIISATDPIADAAAPGVCGAPPPVDAGSG